MSDPKGGTLARLGLIDAEAERAGRDLIQRIAADGVETVRFVFVDPHGLLHGKALVADAVPSALANGVTAPSSLMLKDTSGRTVFPVWTGDAGFGAGVMTGAGDLLMVPDADSYRVLPWAPHAAWVLCDVVQADGVAIPFAPRTVLRTALDRLAAQDLCLIVGLEVEFHVFRMTDDALRHEAGGMPPAPPQTAPLNHGYHLLSEASHGAAEDLLDTLRRTAQEMGMPVRSVEVEFGPSQFEVTFDPAPAAQHADTMVMFRTMVKQVCARRGLHATFMCRPAVPHGAASGWHVHQSLVDRRTGANRFTPDGQDLSPTASEWVAGLLAHSGESCLLTNPTVNSYRRFQPHQLAPDRIQWGRDNRGAMLRALTREGDPASRLENRAPDPSANPYYVFAAQILSGLSGIEGGLTPPAPIEMPYAADTEALPTSLGAAIMAFTEGSLYSGALGEGFHRYMVQLKQAEWDRYLCDLSTWEQREYFGVF